MLNKVILIGNLGQEPKASMMQNGNQVVTFSLATKETWKDKTTGERREKTEWHRIVIYNPNLAGIATKYLQKGSKVYIEGTLQTRKYNDKDGVERQVTEIVLGNFSGTLVMLDSKSGSDYPNQSSNSTQEEGDWKPSQHAPVGSDLDDEIPF